MSIKQERFSFEATEPQALSPFLRDALTNIAHAERIHRAETTLYECEANRRRMLLLNTLRQPLDHAGIEELIVYQQEVARRGILGNCFHIATDACEQGIADGRLVATEGIERLIVYLNHWINYRQVDNKYLLFDLTASANIAYKSEFFHVFGIVVGNVIHGKRILRTLYGGQWFIPPSDEELRSQWKPRGGN